MAKKPTTMRCNSLTATLEKITGFVHAIREIPMVIHRWGFVCDFAVEVKDKLADWSPLPGHRLR
jgi:hypothetical protein